MVIKTVGVSAATLLSKLYQQGKDFFTLSDAENALPDRSAATIRSLLAQMVHRGLLMRLREGIYHIIPYDRDPETYFPDWHLTARHLAGDTPYYIGYFSALALHDLTTQPSFQEQIVVSQPVRPGIQTIKGISFQFIYHNPAHFFGFTRKWVGDAHPVNCSDLEKTLLDCAFRPDYAGGITELAKAVFKAKGTLRPEKMLDHARQFGSGAAIRRLGIILETLDILPNLADNLRALIEQSTSYVALETALPKTGKHVARWGIVQNIELESLSQAVFS